MTLSLFRLLFAAALAAPLAAPAAPFAYVPNEGSGTLSVIDTATDQVVAYGWVVGEPSGGPGLLSDHGVHAASTLAAWRSDSRCQKLGRRSL